MARDNYDESKKKKTTQKAATKTKSQSSSVSKPKTTTKTTTKVNQKASKSTFMGGGASTQKVQKAVSKPKQTTTKVQKNTQQAAQNVIQRSNKSTAMGGTQTTAKVQTSAQKRAEREARTANRDANLYLKQTQIQTSKERRAERAAKDDTRRMIGQAQKSGDYDRASQLRGTQPGSTRAKLEEWDRDLSDTVWHTIKQGLAADARMANLGRKGITQKDAFLYTTEEQRKKADAKVKKLDTKLGKKIEKETQAIQDIQDKHGYLGKQALSAVSSTTGMGMDIAAGAIIPGSSLFHMWTRSTGTSLGEVNKKAENLRKQLKASGQYSDEELDEMFKNVNALDLANAGASGGIEVLSELLFPGMGAARKVIGGKGMSIAERAGAKLFNKVGARATGGLLKSLTRGTLEEVAEEEVGGPLQALAGNLIYGNKFQGYNEDAIKRSLAAESNTLRSNIQTEADAQAAAARLSSKPFMDDSIKSYMESGYSKEEATRLAELSRDYLTASLTGDVDTMKKYQDQMVNIMAGGENSQKQKFSLQDAIDAAVSTSMMTMVTGAPSALSTMQAGNAFKQSAGLDAVKQQAEMIKNWESDPKEKAKAQAIIDHIDNGGDLSGTQVYEIIQKTGELAEERKQPEVIKNRTAQVEMNKRDLRISPINEDGSLAPQTQQRFEQIVSDTVSRHETLARLSNNQDRAEDFVGPEATFDKRNANTEEESRADVLIGANIGAAFEVGAINAEMVNELARGSETVKEVFREVTGIDVSQFSSYNEMNDSLMAEAANNLVNSARIEQVAWNDEARKQVSDYVRSDVQGSQGDLAIQDALESVDPRDRTQFLMTADVASNLYDFARHTEGSWNEARQMVKQMYPSVDTNVLKQVFMAAKEDKQIAETAGYGKVVKSGENLDRGSLTNAETAYVAGKFIDSRENKEGATLTEESLAKNIVSGFGINVILTDQAEVRDEKGNLLVNLGTELRDKDGNVVLDEEGNPVIQMDNGAFIPSSNTLVINAGADATRTVTQTAVHELTHHIAIHAPEEYVKLSRYIMDAWYRKDPEGFTRAIKARQAAYKAQKNQDLSDEQALEEIIADGAADFDWADEDFIADVTTKEPTLASKIIDAIKDVLQKIRSILSSGSVIDERARDALYDKAVELDTVRAMWVKAAQTARKAQADQAVDEWQDRANGNKAEDEAEARYSLTPVEPVQPSSEAWKSGANFAEVKAAHPTLFEQDTDQEEQSAENDKRHLTQVKNTVSTYNKIYNMLGPDFDGTILDASSGLGEGTRSGRENYGFDVDDIEPYPDKNYKPRYMDYSTLNKQYDVVISNAVLNVLTQDDRDAMVNHIGELLKPGGRAYINVRGSDVLNAKNKIAIDESNMEYFIPKTSKSGYYQKGFTPKELKAYLQDALGPGFTVENSTKFGKSAAIVTKSMDADARFSITPQQDADYMKAVESGDMETAQRMVDEAAKANGYVESVYHGTGEYFNIFKMGREGIHLGNIDQAKQVSKNRYHDRSKTTRYTYDEVLNNYEKLDHDAKLKLAAAADRTKWHHTSLVFRDSLPDFDTENFTDDELKKYVKAVSDEYEKNNVYPLGFELPTFDRKVGENLMHLYAKISNPFVIENDLLDWTPSYIAEVLLQRAEGKTNMDGRFEMYGGGFDMDISGSEFNPDDMGRMDLQRLSGGLVKGDQAWRLLEEVLYWNGGYDGIKYLNKYEGDKNSYSYIALKPSDVKSADPVTYDDSGNVIPLSERFNQENPDIRWSVSPEQIEKAEADIGPMVRFSTPTYREIQPKAIYKSGVGFADYFKDASGRDLTYEWTKNNFSKEQADAVVAYLDKMAEWFEQSGEGSLRARYRFIGWDDLTDASVQVKTNDAGEIVGVTVSAMVKNGEYPVNFDLTTVCNKREGITNVIKNLIDKKVDGESVLHSIKLTDENMWKINQALKKENIDTACLGCFVEARRYYAQRFMDKIEDKWNKAVRQARKELGLPENEYFDFAKGRAVTGEEWSSIDSLWTAYDESTESKSSPADRIKILMDEIVKNKDVNSPYLKQIRISDILTPEGINGFKQLSNKGHDMVKTIKSIYGTSAPKEILAFTPYNSEIALLPTEMKGLPTGEYLKSIGGIRVQSFSDFKIAHVFEHFQMVADEAARNFYTHGYSKVIAFPRIFGLTGRKINMSVMFDVLNNKAWSQALGIPVRKAAKYAKKYQGLQFVKELPKENKDNRPYKEVEIEGVHGYLTYLVSDADYVNSIFGRDYRKNIEAGMSEDEARRKANESKPYEQSINYREAVELENQDGYKENVGIIAVAYGDEHLKMLLSDPNVRYIIPYHKSGLPTFISKKTALAIARDYTNFQNTNIAESWKDKNGKDIDLKKEYEAFKQESKAKYPAIEFFKQINDNKYKVKFGSKSAAEKASMAGTADFDVYEPLETAKDIREVSNAYLEHCIEKGWCPIFHEFAGDPNYYKMLFDFAVTDGSFNNIYPQRTVRNRYPGLDIDAKVAAGEQITDEDLVELKKAVEMGAETENRKNMTMAQNMPNVMNDILTRGSENSIIDDTNLNSIRWDTPDYTDVKLGNEEMTPAEEPGDIRRSIAVNFDDAYMDAVESEDMTEAQKLVDEAARMAGMRVAHRYHGTMNATFTVFDKAYAKVGGNSGAGFYFSTEKDDSLNHYQDVEGADNYFKWSSLAEHINDQINEGTWEGPELETYEDVEEYAKEQLNKNPGTYDVYLNYKNPYVRNGRQSTNIFNMLDGSFDDSVVDRNDYDSEDDYDDAWREAYYEHISEKIYEAVYDAMADLENFYDVLEAPSVSDVASKLTEQAIDYESLTWANIEFAVSEHGYISLIRDDWVDSGYGAPEFTRAIIENLGYDAIEDKEVSSKFGQLSREMMTDTEHIIVFKPEQIKLSDPVTYAEDGSIIPLSERFNPDNDDIRYSMPTTDADGEILTDGQMEYFKNSQARDEQGRLVPVYHTTNRGGFTIFDPWYSNDHRSLFFASNWDVSQTYGYRAGNPINLNPGNRIYATWAEVENDIRKRFPEWLEVEDMISPFLPQETMKVSEALNAFVFRKQDNQYADELGVEDGFDNWIEMSESGEDTSDYYVELTIPKAQGFVDIQADNLADLLTQLATELETGQGKQRGYYSVYLNLENPMIVDAQGQNWDAIPYGEYSDDAVLAIKNLTVQDMGNGIYVNIWGDRKVNGEWEDFRESDLFDYETSHDEIPDAVWDNVYDFLLAQGLSEEVAERYSDATFYNFNGLDTYDKDGKKVESAVHRYRTRDLARIAQNEGHDGVIIKNCYDLGGSIKHGANPMSDIYIAFSSNQVKDVNNADPTENPDIRYSIPSEEEVAAYVLDKAESTSDIWYTDPVLQEGRVRFSTSSDNFVNRVKTDWRETRETGGRTLDTDSVKTDVRSLVKTIMKNSEVDKKYDADVTDQATDAVKEIFKLFKSGKLEEAARYAWDAAEDIVKNVEYVDDEMYQKYKGVITYLADTKIAAPAELMDDPEFSEFVTENLAKFLVKKRGEDISNVYTHLNKSWPKMFPKLNHPVDMFLQISEVMDAIQPYTEAYSSEEAAKLTEETAAALVEIAKSGEAYRSAADIMNPIFDEQTKAMKQRHKEALQNVRNRRDELLSKEKEKTAKQKERADKWKERYDERVRKGVEERKAKADKREHLKSFGHIEENYKKLCTWVLNPTKEKNVPEEFRKALAEFLQALDLQTENSKALEEKTGRTAQKTLKMRELKDRLKDLAERKEGDGSSVWEVDASIAFLLDKLSNKLDENGNTIDALDNDDIATIDAFMKLLIRNIERYKQVKTETKMAELSDIGRRCVEFFKAKLDRDGEYHKRKGLRGTLAEINATALTPTYLFDRLGPLKEMYDVLRHNGFDTYIRNEKMITDRLTEILGKYYKTNKKNQNMPGSIIEEWRDERSAQDIKLSNGKTVTMSVAQIMSLRCLVKRGEQAMGHMMVGGIVVTPIQTTSKLSAAERSQKGRVNAVMTRAKRAAENFVEERTKGVDESTQKYVLTEEDIQTILSKLTPDQANIADQLQKLMSVDMAKLGNEAHRELYGYDMFGEDNYFPIKVHGNERATDINNIGDVIEKIKSFGFTKPLTPKAGQAIEIDDIFSVVADHCNGMNLYNAYLVPITDFMKVFNYTHTFENGDSLTMKEAIEQAYGKDMKQYILNLMKDINGIKESNRGGLESIMNKALGRAKRTAVFGNIRVALQQPTAIVRALAEINPKYFKAILNTDSLKGFVPDNTTATMEELYKYCPIAQWKAWGYYDTYMGRDIEDVMMNTWSIGDKLLAGYYGQLDNASWAMIWMAVKAEQAAKHPGMDRNSEEFLQLCGRRASEVFDKTQVVDSTFHRSDAMRSKQIATKLFTAFMAEPTLTLNVFRAGLYNSNELRKEGKKGEANKVLGRAIGTIVLQAVVVSAAQAVADAWRGKDPGLPWGDDDDDDKEGYGWRWLHNFVYNLFDQAHLENNMYLVKDVTPYLNYMMSQAADHYNMNPTLRAIMGWDQDYLYSQNNLVFAGLENTANGVAQLFKKLEKGDEYVDYKTKEPKQWYDIFQKILSGIGTFTGFPAGTLMRDFKPILELLCPSVLAADTSLMDVVAEKMGYRKIGSSGDDSSKETSGEKTESGAKGSESSESEEAAPAEKVDYDELTEKAIKASAKLQGEERDKKIYSIIANGLKGHVENANYYEISKMRAAIEAAGGDVAYFDKQVVRNSKSAFKKSIKAEMTPDEINRQALLYHYLVTHGVSQEEISSEIVYKSEIAKDMKVAFRIGDEKTINEALEPLAQAGILQEDLDRLYKNRNRLDLAKYKENGGRYADKLKSMGTFIWPVSGPITSHFGYRNDVGSVGGSTNHPAIDIGVPIGTPVAAADGGVVIYAGSNSGYGRSVGIKHDNGMVTYYNHLDSWNVKVGDTVAQGQQIACSGNTGRSTGPHLDFKILDANGKPVDPEKYLGK